MGRPAVPTGGGPGHRDTYEASQARTEGTTWSEAESRSRLTLRACPGMQSLVHPVGALAACGVRPGRAAAAGQNLALEAAILDFWHCLEDSCDDRNQK